MKIAHYRSSFQYYCRCPSSCRSKAIPISMHCSRHFGCSPHAPQSMMLQPLVRQWRDHVVFGRLDWAESRHALNTAHFHTLDCLRHRQYSPRCLRLRSIVPRQCQRQPTKDFPRWELSPWCASDRTKCNSRQHQCRHRSRLKFVVDSLGRSRHVIGDLRWRFYCRLDRSDLRLCACDFVTKIRWWKFSWNHHKQNEISNLTLVVRLTRFSLIFWNVVHVSISADVLASSNLLSAFVDVPGDVDVDGLRFTIVGNFRTLPSFSSSILKWLCSSFSRIVRLQTGQMVGSSDVFFLVRFSSGSLWVEVSMIEF